MLKAIFLVEQTGYGTIEKLKGFASEGEASEWCSAIAAEEAVAEKERWDSGNECHYSTYSGVVKDVDISQELFLEHTDSCPHDGNGYYKGDDVVTYRDFATKQRILRRLLKEEGREVSSSRGKISYSDQYGGRTSISLTHRISIVSEGFKLTPYLL